ncbi:solute carrier family 12 member 9-like [Ptychodera flava]|uniref:solute carrier family 12 member 9-like n=1 Tax=Ptychodera flava TaxID=63121 RepID=UPI00396AAD70
MPSRTENVETTPLLHYRLSRSQSLHDTRQSPRQLSTFSGVFIPCVLSMFSVILFLRLGFVVGNAGLLGSMGMYILAYFIVGMTVLSICAISTNGAIEGGGAYFMISRALGPEFGGSIGIMFFSANVFSSALYLLGLIEAIMDNFGPNGFLLPEGSSGLPQGRWWIFLYSSILLFLAFVVCLVGAKMFAKTVLFIFLAVMVALLTVMISFFVVPWRLIKYPPTNPATELNENLTANYTGLGHNTIHENIFMDYSTDYTTGRELDFISIFAVFFNGVTGIMAGANMSGDLKQPSKSIPLGTILACVFTYFTYNVVSVLVAATCTRDLLQNVYSFMQEINVWQPFVVVGIIAASFSAGLSNLIGASRVLNAVAKDDLVGIIFHPFKHESANGNPWPAVVISWALVQVILLIGQLNAIAPIVSIFFLLSYAATNLACLALEWASAPNFRPSFNYFSWHTCMIGMLGCLTMMFLINALYASVSIVVLMILFFYIHYRTPEASWGSISQALIFHQVRKYLLLLDIRKDHVKFWRPQIILLISNPRSSCQLIQFVNDIKKGGLYVLGYVKAGNLDDFPNDPLALEYNAWLSLIDHLKIKAFVELTLCDTIRGGIQHLLRISGLGGMKPNTVILGFYDNCIPVDSFKKGEIFKKVKVRFDEDDEIIGNVENHFAPLRELEDRKGLTAEDYVMCLQDAIKLQKNLCIARYFHTMDRDAIFKSKKKVYMDVWPVNFFKPETAGYLDTACLFLLQISTILHMVPAWNKKTLMRVFLCAENDDEATRKREEKLKNFLNELRIQAEIKIVTWENCIALIPKYEPEAAEEDEMYPVTRQDGITDNYLRSINDLVRKQQENTVVTFCYLPLPPADKKLHRRYLQQLDVMTENLKPTLLVHGINAVTSTAL